MKKIFTLLTLALLTLGAKAQISSFPATEGFEAQFDTGFNKIFIPNWEGSWVTTSVSTTRRIFADPVNFHSGAQALGATPTSSTNDTIIASLNLTSAQNVTMSFWGRGEANGTGTRSAVVYASTSIDGGVTYNSPTQVGDSAIFANLAGQSWATYTYPFSPNTNNQSNVKVRFVISRSASGSGTAAEFLMDDVTFITSTVDIFPPTAVSAVATSTSSINVTFSEDVNNTGMNIANFLGISGISAANVNGNIVSLIFSTPFTEGVFYTLNVANIADLAGNVMTSVASFTIIFNDNTGNVKITEINYNDPSAGTDTLEFLEIKNLDANAINIGGWNFSSGIAYTFPSGYQINAGQYIIISRFSAFFQTFTGKASLEWDANSALNNSGGETITLSNASGVTINSVSYNNALPWDTTANGHGPSLVLCDENADNSQAGSWTASLDLIGVINSTNVYGSPGGPCITVGINETKANDFALTAFPNPSSDLVNINFTSDIRSSYTIMLTDITGRVVNTVNGNATSGANHAELNVSALSPGLYMIIVENAAGKSQLRFTKN